MQNIKQRFKNFFDLNDDKKRIAWLRVSIAFAFIVSIFFAKHLFISDRLYPLDPFFNFLSFIPTWVDYVLIFSLIISLLLTIFSSQPRKFIIINLCITAFLFLEDQGRIFPSYYEYFILFFLLSFYLDTKSESDRSKFILNACRLVLVFVYFWGGIQKINPFFVGQISWILIPISNHISFLDGITMSILSFIIPIAEAGIGIELLFKKTRNFALIEAILMHGSLLFLIGPMRGNWNDSAWIWNLASLLFVFILFYKTQDLTTKDILFNENFKASWIILLFVGILPALNLANSWDSALSVNVYSGNVVTAKIEIANESIHNIPAVLQKYIKSDIFMPEDSKFDVYKWSEDEFNAEPYPEARIFKNITKYICQYAVKNTDIELTIKDKSEFLESAPQKTITYDCSSLEK